MRLSGAQALVKTLVALGVRRVFGIPGAQNLELFDVFLDEDVEVVLSTHEASAAFMADATARLTGRPGVLAVVPGPGLTNTFTGIAEAFQDSIPVVLIAAGIREELPFRYQLHEIPQLDAVRPLAKGVYPLRNVEEIPRLVAEAYRKAASGEPGPVVIELPSDLAMDRAALEIAPGPAPEPPAPSPGEVRRIVEILQGARRAGIYVGQGTFGATRELAELAEILQAPVATTISGRGAIPDDHPLAVGFGFGPSGHPAAQMAFARCDAVLAVGCKFSEVGTGSYGLKQPGRLVHVDANPDVADRNYPADVFVAADAAKTLAALSTELGGYRALPDQEMLAGIEAEKKKVGEEAISHACKESQVSPDRFFALLRKAAARDAILAVDSGNHMFWALSHFPVYGPRTFLAPVDYQSMGYGTPAMVAAAIEHPGRQVLGVVGDGCFLMTGSEIVTAARNDLPVALFVFNDGGLGIIGQIQRKMYQRMSSVRLTNPDYEKLAAAYGMEYARIGSDVEIEEKLSQILPARRPTLVNVLVSYDHPTRYFVGTTKANLRHFGAARVLGMALRAVKRRFFPAPTKPPRVT
ncbi:MAG: thiamine pyrophosphate-binding protein [Planctomycetes bacterium]|nr:thiamine pyrophosphate-binding protein [Planctomycetota bacterium]